MLRSEKRALLYNNSSGCNELEKTFTFENMRKFCDSTEVKLAWGRVFHENKPYFIEFPETPEELQRVLNSHSYRNSTNVFTASHKLIVKYNDNRFGQKRTVKLVLGVSKQFRL